MASLNNHINLSTYRAGVREFLSTKPEAVLATMEEYVRKIGGNILNHMFKGSTREEHQYEIADFSNAMDNYAIQLASTINAGSIDVRKSYMLVHYNFCRACVSSEEYFEVSFEYYYQNHCTTTAFHFTRDKNIRMPFGLVNAITRRPFSLIRRADANALATVLTGNYHEILQFATSNKIQGFPQLERYEIDGLHYLVSPEVRLHALATANKIRKFQVEDWMAEAVQQTLMFTSPGKLLHLKLITSFIDNSGDVRSSHHKSILGNTNFEELVVTVRNLAPDVDKLSPTHWVLKGKKHA